MHEDHMWLIKINEDPLRD